MNDRKSSTAKRSRQISGLGTRPFRPGWAWPEVETHPGLVTDWFSLFKHRRPCTLLTLTDSRTSQIDD